MKRWAMLCVVLLAVPVTVCAQKVVRERPVVLRLDVDASGQVTASKVMAPKQIVLRVHGRRVKQKPRFDPLPEVLVKAAQQVASRWRFKAREVHGKPVSGRTWARATLQIYKQGEDTYGVRVKYISNGPYFYHQDMPTYPDRMLRVRGFGVVVVEGVIQPDHSFSDVHVLKVYSKAAGGGSGFGAAARRAMRTWEGYPEQIDGHPVATHVRIPFIFMIGGVSKEKLERLEQQADHDFPDTAQSSKGTLPSGEAVALDSPFVKQPSS